MVSQALSGASDVLASRFFTKVLTFSMNWGLSRFVDPETLGIAYVSWELLEHLVLGLQKDSFRVVSCRLERTEAAQVVARVGQIIGAVSVVLLWISWLTIMKPSGPLIQTSAYVYYLTTSIVCGASLLQVYLEPGIIHLIRSQRDGPILKFQIENKALISQTFTTAAIYAILSRTLSETFITSYSVGLVSFALGILSRSIALYLSTTHLLRAVGTLNDARMHNKFTSLQQSKTHKKEKSPSRISQDVVLKDEIESKQSFWIKCLLRTPGVRSTRLMELASPEDLKLLEQYLILNVQKLVLNEMERISVLMIYPQAVWGIYAYTAKLGGIFTRLFFTPLEDLAITAYTKVTAMSEQGFKLFRYYFHLQFLISLIGFCLLGNLSGSLTLLLYGPALLQRGLHLVLSRFGLVLVVMAMNGQAEAFLYGSSTSANLKKMRVTNLGITVLSVCTSLALYKWNVVSNQHQLLPVLYCNQIFVCSIVNYILRLIVFLSIITVTEFRKYLSIPSEFHLAYISLGFFFVALTLWTSLYTKCSRTVSEQLYASAPVQNMSTLESLKECVGAGLIAVVSYSLLLIPKVSYLFNRKKHKQ